MEFVLIVFGLQILITGLGVWLAATSWRELPARLMVVLFSLFSVMNAMALLAPQYIWASQVSIVLMLVNGFVLLQVLYSLWYKKACTSKYMYATYLVLFLCAILDLFFHTRVFVKQQENAIYFTVWGFMAYQVVVVWWLPHLYILARVYRSQPHSRMVVYFMVLALAALMLIGRSMNHSILLPYNIMTGVWQIVPLALVLSYVILNTSLLRVTRKALRMAVEQMGEALVLFDRNHKITFANPSGVALGFTEGLKFNTIAEKLGFLELELSGLHEQVVGIDHQRYKFNITPLQDSNPENNSFLLFAQDVTALTEQTAKLHDASTRDTLTGLPNRLAVQNALRKLIREARRGSQGILMFLDLDHFKLVNDTLGHSTGDSILLDIGYLLHKQVNEMGMLARIGADEYAILLAHVDMDTALMVAENCRETIRNTVFGSADKPITLTASVGIVEVMGDVDAQTLMVRADIALYDAKSSGGNRMGFYNQSEDTIQYLSDAHQWAHRMYEAIQNDKLELHFQPIVSIADNHLHHYEVLVRMRSPSGQLIKPTTFISAAERFGLISDLDHYVARKAIEKMAARQNVKLFVNLSAKTLNDTEVVFYIEQLLSQHAVTPERLGIEITETEALKHGGAAVEQLERLQKLGCPIALDDFGVGFTSFDNLRHLPVTQIKIDGSFIRNMHKDAKSWAIVQAIHSLAVSLNKETVAEWVDSADAYQMLGEMGITYAQGYYLGEPQPTLLN